VDRGRVIVLNGPSSAGKSTLAKAVRGRIGPSMAAVSIDQLFPFMHPDTRNNWHLFATLTDALFSTVVSISNGGFDVVVDTVFEHVECIGAMQAALADRSYRLVSVTCPLEVLEAREHARGNRRLGQAREQHERVLVGATYDLRIDTHLMSLDECVDRVVALLS
jgi:chloramphenicol 3-O phosphotransferase